MKTLKDLLECIQNQGGNKMKKILTKKEKVEVLKKKMLKGTGKNRFPMKKKNITGR
jgi:hypothetical protein